ncbi:MAG: hypothetical protein K8L97_15780 [Anaerolineae bacterium]|nr:hypothetical protein [Anaerolineae bacterium]
MLKHGIGLLLLSCLLWMPFSLMAQTVEGNPYYWDAAGIGLSYPADWDEPIPINEDGQTVLQMAQTLADSPDIRPPGIPIINLELLIGDDLIADFTPLLQQTLDELGIPLSATNPITMLGIEGLEATGTSEDEQFFGIARGIQLPDSQVLIISGRSSAAQQDIFTPQFTSVADSLSQGETPVVSTSSAYGVVWNVTRTAADGETAFVNLVGLTYGSNGVLYTVDSLVGVVAVDAQSGAVVATYPNENLILPSDIAAAPDGTVYVADSLCQCVLPLNSDGTWGEPIGGFGIGAPLSLSVGNDGALYVTDQTETDLQVRVFQDGSERRILLGNEIIAQPILSINPAGRVLGLTPDGQVWVLEGETFTLSNMLDVADLVVNDFATNDNGFAVATDTQGVLLLDAQGIVVDQLGRIVANYPLPGEMVSPRGLANAPDGMLYIADSDGSFGAITAMNTRVMEGRVGATLLIPGVVVQGALNPQMAQQDWTLNGGAGQRVTISAVDLGGSMDVALKLIAPDGSEETTNDDHASGDLPGLLDAQITDHLLATSGTYTIRVERVEGDGSYHLAVSTDHPFELSPDGVTQLNGTLADALPSQRWVFQGQAGQIFTITMQAAGGTLDPLLSLYAADGTLIEENDDAADTAMGRNAQIVGVTLPSDGVYYLDARRFEGEGSYNIVMVVTA